MPGTTLPPDQGRQLASALARLERLERRVTPTVPPQLGPRSNIHVSASDSGLTSGDTKNPAWSLSSSVGSDLSITSTYYVTVAVAGIYAVTLAAAVNGSSGSIQSARATFDVDVPNMIGQGQVAGPALGSIGLHSSFTFFIPAGSTVIGYMRGVVTGLGVTWSYSADLWVQRIS